MAILQISNVMDNDNAGELSSKDYKSTISAVKERRPESGNPGQQRNKLDSGESCGKELIALPILQELPNLYKQNGHSVENLGYFIVPRSVTADRRYKSAPIKYQKILQIIFENVAFAPTTYAVGCELIPIAIGQWCVAIRRLMELCNEGVKREEDLICKSLIDRALLFFTKCQFTSQETSHGKTIITITANGFYRISEPTFEPKSSQGRATKEECKEREELKSYDTEIAAAHSEDHTKFATAPSSAQKRKRKPPTPKSPKIERAPCVFTTEVQHKHLVELRGGEETIQKIYTAISAWKDSKGIEKGNDYDTAIKWNLSVAPTARIVASNSSKIKLNQDTRPSNPKNSISFAEEV